MKHDRRGDNPSRMYLVVVPEVIVAQDLALTIEEFDGNAQVLVARTAAEALVLLACTEGAILAFLADGDRLGGGADLSAAVISRGGRIVLLGADPRVPGKDEVILDLPFDSAAVHAILRGLMA